MSMEISSFDIESARGMLLPIMPDAHKGTQGHSLIIAGSKGKMGAAILACMGALRSGSGLVTALIPECGYNAMQTAVPEAMAMTSGIDHVTDLANIPKVKAIGIGPGLGMHDQTASALSEFVGTNHLPLVLDADALNIIGASPSLLDAIPAHSILTPHPGEFTRLFNTGPTVENAMRFAAAHNMIIVLKGAPTHVVSSNHCFVNTTGNAGLATGGSGDVLTGLITGLLAQGHKPMDAALLGVFVHGLAADIGIGKTGVRSFIARDIVSNLGSAFKLIG